MRTVLNAIFVTFAAVATCASCPASADPVVDLCGFGTENVMRYEPGGGGDLVIWTKNASRSYVDIFDSSSPVTLDNHDNAIILDTEPSEIELKRSGDALALCISSTRVALVFEYFYCRAAAISGTDTNNHEFEELRFPRTGEIWLSDVLMQAYEATPGALDTSPAGEDTPAHTPVMQWRVRPFSQVLPDYTTPARACP